MCCRSTLKCDLIFYHADVSYVCELVICQMGTGGHTLFITILSSCYIEQEIFPRANTATATTPARCLKLVCLWLVSSDGHGCGGTLLWTATMYVTTTLEDPSFNCFQIILYHLHPESTKYTNWLHYTMRSFILRITSRITQSCPVDTIFRVRFITLEDCPFFDVIFRSSMRPPSLSSFFQDCFDEEGASPDVSEPLQFSFMNFFNQWS